MAAVALTFIVLLSLELCFESKISKSISAQSQLALARWCICWSIKKIDPLKHYHDMTTGYTVYIYIYTPSTRQWQGFRNDIPLCFVGRIYPCSVGLIDLRRIYIFQCVHVVKALSSKFVLLLKIVLHKRCDEMTLSLYMLLTSEVYFLFPRQVHIAPFSRVLLST